MDDVGNQYTSYTPSSYSEGIAYLYYEDSGADPESTLYTMFVDYSYIDVSVTADSTDDTTDDTEDTTTDNDTNMWLFVSSLVIAIALIIAVIGLIVQKIVKKAHTRKPCGNEQRLLPERRQAPLCGQKGPRAEGRNAGRDSRKEARADGRQRPL